MAAASPSGMSGTASSGTSEGGSESATGDSNAECATGGESIDQVSAARRDAPYALDAPYSLLAGACFLSTSGPSPGAALSSMGGGSFLRATASLTTSVSSSVVPRNVLRKFGSHCANDQRTAVPST